MRNEIEELIKNSGTSNEEEIIKGYKSALKSIDTSDNEVEKLIQNKEVIQNLKYQIVLDRLNIQDDEIEEIAQMIAEKKPNTRQIFLSGNHITDKGAIKLAHAFLSLNLSYLDLQNNKIGAEGFRAVYDLAARQPELDLALRGNKLSEVGAVERIKIQAKRKYEKEKEKEKDLSSTSKDPVSRKPRLK